MGGGEIATVCLGSLCTPSIPLTVAGQVPRYPAPPGPAPSGAAQAARALRRLALLALAALPGHAPSCPVTPRPGRARASVARRCLQTRRPAPPRQPPRVAAASRPQVSLMPQPGPDPGPKGAGRPEALPWLCRGSAPCRTRNQFPLAARPAVGWAVAGPRVSSRGFCGRLGFAPRACDSKAHLKNCAPPAGCQTRHAKSGAARRDGPIRAECPAPPLPVRYPKHFRSSGTST